MMPDPCFTLFKQNITEFPLPERFTFPFYYQPHPLCLIAAEELQESLTRQSAHYHFAEQGKMLGVLLVINAQGEVGYLSGFSGKLTLNHHSQRSANTAKSDLINFVPFVFDSTRPTAYFQQEQSSINLLNNKISAMESNHNLIDQQTRLVEIASASQQAISLQQNKLAEQRQLRKSQRSEGQKSFSESEFSLLKVQLAKESVRDKNSLKALKLVWQQRIDNTEFEVKQRLNEINVLKKARKNRSIDLQQYLFQQYQFLTIKGETKNLTELFTDTAFHQRYGVPPSGSGDCAAPKLLQYAFKQRFKPLALAEFWWGKPPKSAIRQHKNFYSACIGKCQPILTHMLKGMLIDDDPLSVSDIAEDALTIIYQDDDVAVVNKPSGLLSVPGKNIVDSVFTRMKQKYPNATGPLIVHRLDMSTSGLMVIALTKEANQHLQQQFIKRTVEKRYVALLEGEFDVAMDGDYLKSGEIDLPLLVDFDDRPRQMVCLDSGKSAQTYWQSIPALQGQQAKTTRVHLYPKTGRTHQLRIHCAHTSGLNMPIVGDDLYGKPAERLHLHAGLLVFKHPKTEKTIRFEVATDF